MHWRLSSWAHSVFGCILQKCCFMYVFVCSVCVFIYLSYPVRLGTGIIFAQAIAA